LVRQLAEVMDLPFLLVGSVIVGAGIGYLLDLWLHTSPIFALIFGAGGFVGGFLEVLRRVSGKQKDHGS
jgi:ATP synthase protein I